MKTAIVGSCVTRDSCEFRRSEFGTIDYFARTSWVAQGSRAWPAHVDTYNVTPPLYGRFMRLDAYKTLRRSLRRAKPDVLYLDLVDERLPIHRVGGGWFTEGDQWSVCGFGRSVQENAEEVLEYGDERRHELFKTMFSKLMNRITGDLNDKPIVLHKAWLTDKSVDGDTAFTERVHDFVQTVNTALDRDYRMIENKYGNRIRTVEAAEENVLADPDQRWGLAPFHYIPDYYDDISRQLLEVAAAPERPSAGKPQRRETRAATGPSGQPGASQ